MTIEKFRDFWQRAPFQPFDIRVSDGRVYTVDHPEYVKPSRDGKILLFETEDYREIAISLSQVTSFEVANVRSS